jgi:hypothetical protein
MTDFGFIGDDELRHMIERDMVELDVCMEHGLCKSAIVLSGSIIEAILADYYFTFPRSGMTSEQVLRAELGPLINWATEDKLIPKETADLSEVIQGYRNLIHCGREKRKSQRLDLPTARAAVALVDMIVPDIARGYRARKGDTAEELIAKVRRDPTCTSLFTHMIVRMRPAERVRLMRLIPAICIGEGDSMVLDSLRRLHRMVIDEVPGDALASAVSDVYKHIRIDTKEGALIYQSFYSHKINTLPPDQGQAVIDYVLGAFALATSDEVSTLLRWGSIKPEDIAGWFHGLQIENDVNALIAKTVVRRSDAMMLEMDVEGRRKAQEGAKAFLDVLWQVLEFAPEALRLNAIASIAGDSGFSFYRMEWAKYLQEKANEW